ncbi:MAG: hypothetical protein AB3N64_10455 [Puniceicoccaceae bacterium]
MSNSTNPELLIHVGAWSLFDEADPTTETGLRHHLAAIREAGFHSYCGAASYPGLKEGLAEFGLRFGGGIDAATPDQMPERIADCLAIDNGPINCQLADHDTPVERAIELTIALMEESERQGAEVHLEVHRDTCTETPEKAYAIIEGYKKVKGTYPRVNFDFSHPAVVKHLVPENYIDRLFENIPCFQQSTLWHVRPFNGHHCMIPITDGKGNFSPEYEACRPFIRQGLQHWLDGPRPGNRLWVVPEQGTTIGYNLSCFPNIWQDTIVLGKDIQAMWDELISN